MTEAALCRLGLRERLVNIYSRPWRNLPLAGRALRDGSAGVTINYQFSMT